MRQFLARHPLRFTLVVLAGGLMLASCGEATVASTVASTATSQPPTDTPIPPTSTAATAETTCLPDDFGIYASQTTYVMSIDVPNVPAPPQTKHGIGDSGTNANGTFGGDSGMCTNGSAAARPRSTRSTTRSFRRLAGATQHRPRR